MRDLAIYGFGGLGHEVACLISHINQVEPTWNLIGFFDDHVEAGSSCKYGSVLGDMDTLNTWDTELSVAIAVGSSVCLKKISERISNPKIDFPNIIAPNCFYFDEGSLHLGKGNIITFGCRISCDVTLGDFNVLDGCVSLGHDVVLGNYNMLFPDVRISGLATIGDGNVFGARAFVSQCIRIGSWNRFGAGCYIFRKIKDGALYMGNPAKRIDIE